MLIAGTVIAGIAYDFVRQHVNEVLADNNRAAKLLRQQLQTELERLDRQEENLLDLVSEGKMPTPKVRARLNAITVKQNKLRQELGCADRGLGIPP